jgi:flagellar motor switch protein FliG
LSDRDRIAVARPEVPGPGAQRAAAVLLGLGPDVSAAIFKLLDETIVRRIALGARELRKNPGAVAAALNAFVQAMDSIGGDAVASDGLLREMAVRAMGVESARRAFDGVEAPPPSLDEGLGAAAQADPEALATILAREQPQTAALVLGALDSARAAAVLKHIPEAQRPQILRRLATLEAVDPEVLREVGLALSHELKQSVTLGTRKMDGQAATVQLLRRISAIQQSEVISEIEREDPDLAGELRGKLFTFEDLGNLVDRDLQTLIREIDVAQLAIALKGSSSTVRDKLIKNMSSRGGQMLNDDIAAMGPVKLAAVEAAQAELVKIAFGLAEQGRITIVGPAERMV